MTLHNYSTHNGQKPPRLSASSSFLYTYNFLNKALKIIRAILGITTLKSE